MYDPEQEIVVALAAEVSYTSKENDGPLMGRHDIKWCHMTFTCEFFLVKIRINTEHLQFTGLSFVRFTDHSPFEIISSWI